MQDPCAPSLHFETHVVDLSASAAAAAEAAAAAGAAVAAAAGAAAVAPVGAVAADGGVAVAEALTAVGVVVDLAVDAAAGCHQEKLGDRLTSQWAGCVESQETAPGVH